MRIKTPFLICLALFIGAAGGGFAIKVIESRKAVERMRYAQELMLISYGQRAFESYRRDPPEMAIVAIEFHLRDLESRTNWNGPTLFIQDINWWQALAHARLSLLYSRIGKPEVSSNHVSRAVEFLAPGRVARTLPTDGGGLMRWVQDADRRNSWL
jgi:hypothetical protein